MLAATPCEEFRWLGKLGIHGIADGEHFFVLTANDDGTTRLRHGERFSGVLVALQKAAQEEVALLMKHSVRRSNNAPSSSAKRNNERDESRAWQDAKRGSRAG